MFGFTLFVSIIIRAHQHACILHLHRNIFCSHNVHKITKALIVTEQRCFATRKRKRSVSHDFTSVQAGDKSAESKEPMEVVTKSVVCGIVTRIDLLEFISSGGNGTKSEF